MTTEEPTLVDKLQEVQSAVDEEDYGVAVPLCEKVLSLLKEEDGQEDNASLVATVHEIYVKSLLHQKDFEKVLGLTPPQKECRPQLEALQAYAAYRLGRYDYKQANKDEGEMAAHIRAQTHFHKSETAKALEAYQQLMNKHSSSSSQEEKEEDDDFFMEAYTNATAVLAANATPYDGTSKEFSMRDKALQFLEEQESEFPYDLAYNLASLDLLQADALPDRQEAMGLLKQAVRECKEANSGEEEAKQELEPMELNLHWGKTFWGEEVPPTKTAPCSSIVNFMLKNQINPVLADGQNNNNQKANEKTIQSLQSLLKLPPGKINALQKRLCVYNMAVLQLQIQDYDNARQTLDALMKSLSSNKKNNKKQKASAIGTDIPAPASDADSLWWKARADVLLAYSYYLQEEEETDNSKQLDASIQKLKGHLEKATTTDSKMRDHLVLYLELHLQQLTAADGFSSDEQFQWLQQQKQPKPATTATLAKAYQDRQQPDKAKELLLKSNDSGGDNGNQIIAEMAMAQENYKEAIGIYEQADASNHEARARLVVALSHVDPQRAIQEWKSLVSDGLQLEEDDEEEEEEDGEALEQRELPRIKHTAVSEALATGTTTSSTDKKKKKSQESILRRREKQRKAHLAKLQEKGLYNPSRPIQPDPERWIPKHERQKRRRRGGNQSKASQGGVSAKDAAKLDVAARANAEPDASAGPSTAHLTVAGGARKGGRRR